MRIYCGFAIKKKASKFISLIEKRVTLKSRNNKAKLRSLKQRYNNFIVSESFFSQKNQNQGTRRHEAAREANA